MLKIAANNSQAAQPPQNYGLVAGNPAQKDIQGSVRVQRLGQTPPATTVASTATSFSGTVAVGTTAVNVVPALSFDTEDYYEVTITNTSATQVISLNTVGTQAVANSGKVLQVNQTITWSSGSRFQCPRTGISAIASAGGGSVAVEYR